MPPIAAVEVVSTPALLAFSAVLIVGLRLRGLLTDEIVCELYQPFSRSTLTVIGVVVVIWQFAWFAGRL